MAGAWGWAAAGQHSGRLAGADLWALQVHCRCLRKNAPFFNSLSLPSPPRIRYVLWEDGRAAWDGLPSRLHNQLNGRQKSLPGVETLSIGPHGEWFVRFLDGSWRSNGMAAGCSLKIAKLQQQGHDIASVVFGEDWTWAILYV